MRKIDDKSITNRDAMVFFHNAVQGKTLDQTAQELGISRDTVKRTKKKSSYRDLVIAYGGQIDLTMEAYVRKLKELMYANKTIKLDSGSITVPDNTTQLNATLKFGRILGDEAPKETSVQHTIAGASDEELHEAFESALASLQIGDDEGSSDGPVDGEGPGALL